MLGRAKPMGVLRKLRPRKHRPQTLKISDPWKTQTPGCLENSDSRKTQTPRCLENSDPQYFSNITTNCSPRAASLSFPSTEGNGFAEIPPERKFALQTISTKPNFWSRAMKFCSTGERFDPSWGNHILDKKGYFGTRVRTPQTNSS